MGIVLPVGRLDTVSLPMVAPLGMVAHGLARNGSASPANGCVKPRLAFSLESPLDESERQAREIKSKNFRSEASGRFTLSAERDSIRMEIFAIFTR